MNDDALRIQLEELEIEDDKIDSILDYLNKTQEILKINYPINSNPETEIIGLQNKLALLGEKDWRKRAALAARIISLRFEE